MPCPRPKAIGEATAAAALSVLCRMEALLHVPCRLCSNLCTPRWHLLFFSVTLSICIQPVICKRMQIFLWKAATWPSLLLFLAAYQFKQVVVKGCTIRRMQTSWTWGKWLLDHKTESLWKGDCYSHFCCRVAALHVPMKRFCKHNNTVSFLQEGCLPVSALRDYENAHISISSGM